MRDAKSVTVVFTPRVSALKSIDALSPRSAFSGRGIVSRDKPAASVSSRSGVGAKNPEPAEMRLDQSSPFTRTEMRGLTKVP